MCSAAKIDLACHYTFSETVLSLIPQRRDRINHFLHHFFNSAVIATGTQNNLNIRLAPIAPEPAVISCERCF